VLVKLNAARVEPRAGPSGFDGMTGGWFDNRQPIKPVRASATQIRLLTLFPRIEWRSVAVF
jgi:hypothetical protein